MASSMSVFAHSGRTDSSGGHHDNNNVSGLGSYHYHCGGYPAHLHEYGYCPYTDVFPYSVSISTDKSTARRGETINLSTVVYPSNSCNSSVSWESSNTDVIQISNGKATAVGFGEATLTATTFNGISSSIILTVQEVKAESITISSDDLVLFVRDEAKLSANITPDEVDNKSVLWSSGDENVLTVDDAGLLYAVGPGKTTISATTENGKSDSINVTVNEIVAESITIKGHQTMTIGDSTQLNAELFPANVSFSDITWTSDDESIVSIDKNGTVTAKSVGHTTIYATQKDVSTSFQIEVLPISCNSIKIYNTPENALLPNDTITLSATISPSDATYKQITWSSSNKNIASIDEYGTIIAKKPGHTIITVTTYDGKTDSFTLKVSLPAYIIAIIIVTCIVVISLISILIIKIRKKSKKGQNTYSL